MVKLYLMVGLVGSGKSKWAKQKVKKTHQTVIINRDKIRDMIHGGTYRYTREIEDTVKQVANMMLTMYLDLGYNVILDETSLTIKQRNIGIMLARTHNADVEIVWCVEDNHNLEYRMITPRGTGREEWRKIINKQKKLFQIPALDECDILTKISITRENGGLSFTVAERLFQKDPAQ